MLELAEGLRATYGKHAVTTFIKDDQFRYRTFCDTFAALNDCTPAELHSRFRTITDSKLVWHAATPIIIESDQHVMEHGVAQDYTYIFRPRTGDWRKLVVLKQRTKEREIEGVCFDITREERHIPLLSEAMDYTSECLWIDQDERTKLTRSDLVVLSYYLEGVPQREIATKLSVTPKAIEKRVRKMRDLIPQLCGCQGQHDTVHRCCFELGLTELLLRKRDWFDRQAVSFRVSAGTVWKSLL